MEKGGDPNPKRKVGPVKDSVKTTIHKLRQGGTQSTRMRRNAHVGPHICLLIRSLYNLNTVFRRPCRPQMKFKVLEFFYFFFLF